MNILATRSSRGSKGFTLIELLVVIAIIGILASLITTSGVILVAKSRENKMRGDRDLVVSAIDHYAKDIGAPPPDGMRNGLVNSGTNQLFYELVGATNTGSAFVTSVGKQITANELLTIFGVQNIQNSNPETKKNFLESKSETLIQPLPSNPNIYVLAEQIKGVTYPWHYDASSPLRHHNPGYDLWIEFQSLGKTKIIGNWDK